jgi:hypothetical protein
MLRVCMCAAGVRPLPLIPGATQCVSELTYQYRMNESIQLLANSLVYNNALKCGSAALASSRLGACAQGPPFPLLSIGAFAPCSRVCDLGAVGSDPPAVLVVEERKGDGGFVCLALLCVFVQASALVVFLVPVVCVCMYVCMYVCVFLCVAMAALAPAPPEAAPGTSLDTATFPAWVHALLEPEARVVFVDTDCLGREAWESSRLTAGATVLSMSCPFPAAHLRASRTPSTEVAPAPSPSLSPSPPSAPTLRCACPCACSPCNRRGRQPGCAVVGAHVQPSRGCHGGSCSERRCGARCPARHHWRHFAVPLPAALVARRAGGRGGRC